MLTKTQMNDFLKEYWSPAEIDANLYENFPLLARIPKNTEVGGEIWVVPIDLDDGAEGSPTFSTAQAIAAATSSQKGQFLVDYVEDFQLAQVENKIIRLTRNTPKLALEKAARESKRAMRLLSKRIARSLYRSGYGEKGRVDSGTTLTSSVIKLTNKLDARNFHIGDQLQFGSALTGAALRDSGDFVSVTKVDAINGLITTDAPTNLQTSITGIAANDYIFLKDARSSTDPGATKRMITGLAGWIPDNDPVAAENFFGKDRSVWPDRYAGFRSTQTGKPYDQAIIDALIEAANLEIYPNDLYVDPAIYGALLKVAEGRFEKITETVGKIGFKGLEVQIGYGSSGVKIFPDPSCPAGRGYALTMDTWELGSAGDLIQNDLQHQDAVDIYNASAVEFRWVFTGAMVCKNPKQNMVIKFT